MKFDLDISRRCIYNYKYLNWWALIYKFPIITCLSSKGGDDLFEVFFDADLIIAAGGAALDTAYRAKKLVRRLDYNHFVQFDKKLEAMTLEEFDTLKKKFGYAGTWERIWWSDRLKNVLTDGVSIAEGGRFSQC